MSNQLITPDQMVDDVVKLFEEHGITEMYNNANDQEKKKIAEALMCMFSAWQ